MSNCDQKLTGPTHPPAMPKSVEFFVVRSEKLTGPIPTELAQSKNLQHLYLLSNQLTGPIPAGLAN